MTDAVSSIVEDNKTELSKKVIVSKESSSDESETDEVKKRNPDTDCHNN